MSPTSEPLKYLACRVCLFCGRSEDYPLKDPDGWSTSAIENATGAISRNEYWRCADCTAEDSKKAARS